MSRFVKNHRVPASPFTVSGILAKDGKPDTLALGLHDNGDKYIGQWYHGMFQGSGVYDSSNGEQYRGDYVREMRNGMGVLRKPDGTRYEGKFKDDKKHGACVEFFANGNKLHGEYQNGRRTCSVFTWANGDRALIKCDDSGQEIQSARNTSMAVDA